MAATTNIGWCDATVNFWWGCTKVSPACDHCYAETWAKRLGKDLWGNGKDRWKIEGAAALAFKLERKAVREGRRLKVFSNSMSDFFDSEVPDEWRDQALAVIALTPHLDWLVLTKRPKVMRAYLTEQWQGVLEQDFKFGDTILHQRAGQPTGRRLEIEEACEPLLDRFGLNDPEKDDLWTENGSCKAMQWQWPLPNLWLGVTAENQKMADLRIPELLATPAARRFVSCEPLLEEIDLNPYLFIYTHEDDAMLLVQEGDEEVDPAPIMPVMPFHDPATTPPEEISQPRLDWVIVGGESGKDARPMDLRWARSLRDQCVAAGVPFFFKQWGEWVCTAAEQPKPEGNLRHREWNGGYCSWRVGKNAAGNVLDGFVWDQVPG